MVRFLVLESLLLGCLLFVGGYVFWQSIATAQVVDMLLGDRLESSNPGPVGVPPFVVVIAGLCCLIIILYFLMQWWGMTTRSFWMVTLAALVPQFPAVLAHNQLDWALFWRVTTASPELSQITLGGLFLLSLAMLVTLHRVAELRRLRGRISALRLERGEQGQIIANEVLALAGLVGSTLVVTVALMSAAAGFARMGNLLVHSPWTVLSIGAVAFFLMALFLHLWLRAGQDN